MKAPRWLWIMVVTVVGNTAAYAVYRQLQPPAPPPSTPTPDEVRVEFTSTPSGAAVRDGDQIVGTTPFIQIFVVRDPDETKSFAFALDGYQTVVVQRRLDRASIEVTATLQRAPAAEPPPPVKTRVERPRPARPNRRRIRAARPARNRRPRRPPAPKTPPATEEPAVAIPKLSDTTEAVPRLGGDRGDGAPARAGANPTLPKLQEDEQTTSVPKLAGEKPADPEGTKVPKIGQEPAVPKVEAPPAVPKMD